MAESEESGLVRRLGLRLDAREGGEPDFPAVTILVDGEEIFASVGGRRYVGCDPADILGRDSPLLPADPARRVGIYPWDSLWGRGDGCIAPLIFARGDQVVWSGFRDFTGIYDKGPTTRRNPDISLGFALDIPDVVFDGGQYRTEVRRASADRSWESERRKTTRLLGEYLVHEREHLAALGWTLESAWTSGSGCRLAFWDDDEHLIVVDLTERQGTPEDRARKMTEFLLSTPPEQWPVTGRGSRGG